MRLILRCTLTPANGAAISRPLCVEMVDRKLNDFIATSMHSSVHQSHVTSSNGDNDSESTITTATLSTVTATRPSSDRLWKFSHRNKARRILQVEPEPDESKLIWFKLGKSDP